MYRLYLDQVTFFHFLQEDAQILLKVLYNITTKFLMLLILLHSY